MSSAYHPQSQALVERDNKTIAERLRCNSTGIYRKWDVDLNAIMFAINTAENRTTAYTPFYLLHGYEARKRADNHYGVPTREKDVMIDRNIARIRIDMQQVKTLDERMEKAIRLNFRIGEFVFLSVEVAEQGKGKKLSYKAEGPYLVMEVGDTTAKVMNIHSKKITIVNLNRLKKYYGKLTPAMQRLHQHYFGALEERSGKAPAEKLTPEPNSGQEQRIDTPSPAARDKTATGTETEIAQDKAYFADDDSETEIYDRFSPSNVASGGK